MEHPYETVINIMSEANKVCQELIKQKQNNMKQITITEENKSLVEALSKLNTGDKITFSENSILIEQKEEFKSGDCLIADVNGDHKIIFAEEIQGEGEKQKIIFNKSCEWVYASQVLRKATDEEINSRIEYLNSKGKDCDIKQKVEFKRGDFITTLDGACTLIYMGKDTRDAVLFQVFFTLEAGIRIKDKIDFGYGYCDNFRHAKEYEKQALLGAMHDQGKDWDAEKLEIVDWVWKPKKGDVVYFIDSEAAICSLNVTSDNYYPSFVDFRTKELAEAALELLKNAKHY